MNKRLLVNADDFGLSTAINSGILSSHLQGIVTSTSIVASGDAFDEAVNFSRLHPSLATGVHLTLVEERPVSSYMPELPRTYGLLVKAVSTGRIKLLAVERELRAQIEKCLAAGLKITHLDSHQHTHAFPLLFPLVVRLAEDYSIPGIRLPRSWPHSRDICANRFLAKCVLCLLAHSDAILFSLGNRVTTQRFAGLFESGDLTEQALLRILASLQGGTTELGCHPANADSTLRYANWNAKRQVELASLTSPRIKEAINQLRIELISYRELSTCTST